MHGAGRRRRRAKRAANCCINHSWKLSLCVQQQPPGDYGGAPQWAQAQAAVAAAAAAAAAAHGRAVLTARCAPAPAPCLSGSWRCIAAPGGAAGRGRRARRRALAGSARRPAYCGRLLVNEGCCQATMAAPEGLLHEGGSVASGAPGFPRSTDRPAVSQHSYLVSKSLYTAQKARGTSSSEAVQR